MMQYPEKRDFTPDLVRCPISMREFSNPYEEIAHLVDLDADSIRFISPRALDTGAHLQITVQPGSPVAPPLEAAISVLRCERVDSGFDIAASIDTLVAVDYSD